MNTIRTHHTRMKTAPRAVLLCLSLLLAAALRTPVQAGPVRLLESAPGHLLIEATFRGERFLSPEGAPEGYVLLTAPGCGHSREPGAPMLPQAGYLLGLPPEGQPRAEVIEEVWETVSTDPLCPAPNLADPSGLADESPRWSMR